MGRPDTEQSLKTSRYVELIHQLGLRDGWRDRDAEGRTRNYLLGLRFRGTLNRQALLDDMRARGHGDSAVRRLDALIDKTYLERGPRPEAGLGTD